MGKINVKELEELFIEIKYGNKIAFEKLYNNYNKLIYSIAYSILKNKQDAEDVAQIVFEKLYSIDKDKLPTRNESSWLYSVTKNETINYLKHNKNNIDLDSIYNIEDDNNEINIYIGTNSSLVLNHSYMNNTNYNLKININYAGEKSNVLVNVRGVNNSGTSKVDIDGTLLKNNNNNILAEKIKIINITNNGVCYR